jgi:hypothetical protein
VKQGMLSYVVDQISESCKTNNSNERYEFHELVDLRKTVASEGHGCPECLLLCHDKHI